MNSAATNVRQSSFRVESDSLGEVNVPTLEALGRTNRKIFEHQYRERRLMR